MSFFKRRKVFRLDLEMVHLAIELAAAEAIKAEVARQFAEQFPGLNANINNANFTIKDLVNIDYIDMTDGYEVEVIKP